MLALLSIVFLSVNSLVSASDSNYVVQNGALEPLVYHVLSPAYFVSNTITDLRGYPVGSNPSTFVLYANDTRFNTSIGNITDNHIPVVVGKNQSDIPFNLTIFNQNLNTIELGRNLIIGDVIPTTMNIARDFSGIPGLVAIANEQTIGRGSMNSSWNSPRGDLMITVNVKLNDQKYSPFLAPLCALSLINATLTSDGGNYSQLPIGFSWPISIFWKGWEKKLGGVLVETNEDSFGNVWNAVGCGLRVNSHINYSISEAIREHNNNNPSNPLQNLQLETLISRSLNVMEQYLQLLESNPQSFVDIILKNWVNYQQIVTIMTSGKVVGISSDGSLIIDDNRGFTAYLKNNVLRMPSQTLVFT